MDKEGADETPLADSLPSEEDEHKCPEAYGKMIEKLLMPDENGMVRKDMLVEFFQKTVGTMFEDNKATEVLDSLQFEDGTNMIRLEVPCLLSQCFLKKFAEKYCSEEALSGIVEFLGSRPEALEDAWDWKGMMSNIGLELSDTELKEAVVAAKNLAEMLLMQREYERDSPDGENEEDGQGQILQAVQENLHLMGLGEVGEEELETKDEREND